MGRISERTIGEVKARARILDVFENVDLKRMGQEYLTLCPWHNDQRPSLSINPSKNFAYCHVCQHSVDPLGWLVDRGATFVEAIEQLAARYGIPILLDNPADNEKFEAERRERAALYQQREKQQLEYAENLLRIITPNSCDVIFSSLGTYHANNTFYILSLISSLYFYKLGKCLLYIA
jgi:DNA primase